MVKCPVQVFFSFIYVVVTVVGFVFFLFHDVFFYNVVDFFGVF